MRKALAAIGSALFFLLAPGATAVLIPWLLTGWEVNEYWLPARVAGVVYTPAYAVRDTVIVEAMFVRPAMCHYYFGDYYGPRYVGLGFTSAVVRMAGTQSSAMRAASSQPAVASQPSSGSCGTPASRPVCQMSIAAARPAVQLGNR